MKLIIVLAVIAYSNGDKLDRRYLPPSSASTAGGSPGSLQAPLETQRDQSGSNFGTIQTPFESQRNNQAPNQRQYPTYEEGQNELQTQPGLTGQGGTSAQQSQFDIQKPRLPGFDLQQDTFNQPGSGLQKIPGQQFDRPSQNEYERQSDYQKPVGSAPALQNYPSSSQISPRPDFTGTQQSPLGQPKFRQNENSVAQNIPIGQQINQPTFITNEEEIGRPSVNGENYPGFNSVNVQNSGFVKDEQTPFRQPSSNNNYDNALQRFGGQNTPNEQSSSGLFRGQNVDNNRDTVRPERLQAEQDRTAEILRYENDNDGETFAYNFETSNGITAEEHGIATNGVQAEGAFSYIGDDGQSYSVTYTADENGYQPQGAHLPTPHPIPDVILKSIERNALAAANARNDGTQFNGNNGPTRSQQYNAEPQEYSDGIESQQPYKTQSGPQTYNNGFSKPQVDLNTKPQSYNPQSGAQTYNAGLSQPKSGPTPSQQQYNPQSLSQTYNTGFSQPQSSSTLQQQEYNTQSEPQTYNTGSMQPGQETDPRPKSNQYNVPSPQQQFNAPSASQGYPYGPQNVSPSLTKSNNEVSSNLPSQGNDCSDPNICYETGPQYNKNSQPQRYTDLDQSSQPESTPIGGSYTGSPSRSSQQFSSGIQQNQGSPQSTGPFRNTPKSTNRQEQYSRTPQENLPSQVNQQRPNVASTANSLGQYRSPIESSNKRTGSGPQLARGESTPLTSSQKSSSGPYNYPVPSQSGQKSAFGTNNDLRKNVSPFQGRVPNQERGSNSDNNQLRPDGFQTAIQEPVDERQGPLPGTKPFGSQGPNFNVVPAPPSNNQYYQENANSRPGQSTTFPVAPSSNQQVFKQPQKQQGFLQSQQNKDNFGIQAQAPYRGNQAEGALQQFSNTNDKQRQDTRFPPYGPVLAPSSNLAPNEETEQNSQAPQDSIRPSNKQPNIPSSQIGIQAQTPSRGNSAQLPTHQYSSNTPRQEQQNINAPQFSSPNQDISRKPFGSQSGTKTPQNKPSAVAYNAQGSQNQPSRSQQYNLSSQQSGTPDSNQKQDADKYPDTSFSYDAPQSGASSVGSKTGQISSRGPMRFNNSGPKSEQQFPSSRQPPSFSAQEGYKY